MEIRDLNLDEWNRVLPSAGFDVFQTREALSAINRNTDAEMRLLGGFKGEEAVALLPAFIQERAVGRAVFSPPPSMGIPHMGPIMMPTSPKRRKIERVNRDFTRGVVDELDVDSRSTLFRLVGNPEFTDPRPFTWYGQRTEPRFTYTLDVSGDPEDIMMGFSSDLRSNIRKAGDLDLDISVEDGESVHRIADDVTSRYEEQGETAPFTTDYVCDLADSLGKRARPYVARDADGEYVGGMIILYSNDRAYFWQGGVSRDYEGVSVNSLLHWRIINDVAKGSPIESIESYDLVGANTERLCSYKSKFGASLDPYYLVESTDLGLDIAKKVYRVLHG